MTQETAHTPGPWTADVQDIIRDSNGNEIATCAIAAQLLNVQANARLIAAAPDLLAALKEIVAETDGSDTARAAIAKAEGTS